MHAAKLDADSAVAFTAAILERLKEQSYSTAIGLLSSEDLAANYQTEALLGLYTPKAEPQGVGSHQDITCPRGKGDDYENHIPTTPEPVVRKQHGRRNLAETPPLSPQPPPPYGYPCYLGQFHIRIHLPGPIFSIQWVTILHLYPTITDDKYPIIGSQAQRAQRVPSASIILPSSTASLLP
ncbi:hypothetical protein EVAR_72464_1 [Eumeta japonica]|uniref:Uncharacterized protein n=1 Tax=Eumeta variegata TaxID=151549 RepID=A0A4C1SCW5_EUMVA|nr:hypothetical protein EVAR_72464_1 [Eumeta japonica]